MGKRDEKADSASETGELTGHSLDAVHMNALDEHHSEKQNLKSRRRREPLPPWIRRSLGGGKTFSRTRKVLQEYGIETICTNANCPNLGECWSRGTATLLILGNICTRNCPFCAVRHGTPQPPDPEEPERAGETAYRLGLKYLVLTSVDRDDLPDGGASQFQKVITACRKRVPDMRFELLVPDFKGCRNHALEILEEARPFVFGHNAETVPELYAEARPGGDYQRSLELLHEAHRRWPEIPVKSSLMLGLGETEKQVLNVLRDLLDAGCTRTAIGQYLQPTADALPVKEYISPERFAWWQERAYDMGFTWAAASPFTRSSYHAEMEIPSNSVQ